MKNNDIYQLLIYFVKTMIFVFLYLGLYWTTNKIFVNKIIRIVLIGLSSPFLIYYLLANSVYFVGYTLYFLELKELGVFVLLINFIAKPIAIIAGIITTICIIKNKDIKFNDSK